MGADAKEFITNIPGQKVRRRIIQALLDQGTTRPMEFGLPVGGVQEDVGVEDQQSGFIHRRIQLGTIRHVHECPTTAPSREHRAGVSPVLDVSSLGQNASQRRFHECGNSRSPPGRLFTQSAHHVVVYVERCLHMDNHTQDMDNRQARVSLWIPDQAGDDRRDDEAGYTAGRS